jgi:hypothetical protein
MKNDEIRVLFETYIADIRYTKQQQWNTIYLTLIALAAIASLVIAFPRLPCLFRISLTAACPFIGALGICYIWNYHKDLSRYRTIKDYILDEKKFRVTLTEVVKKSECWRPKWKYIERDFFEFVGLFSILIVLATTIAMMVLWIPG